MKRPGNSDDPRDIARDVAAVGRISAVPSLLKLVCQNTGMGFAAVARVTDGSWTACAVQDDIQFGLAPGGQLDVRTTLCREARAAREPVVIDHASRDPVYAQHHTPKLYNIESYISVPIIRPGGDYFGNLCAIDPRPRTVSDPRTVTMFKVFADLIALQLESEDHQIEVESALALERATADLREQFIAVLGHDLRNPLAAVGATAELMVRSSAEPQMVALGTRLRATARRMSKLIDDVLDFARGRLGSGMGIEALEVPDLASYLRDVVAEAREANPERGVTEGIAIDRAVRCDRGRMQQLLSNLLGNALTYGAADRPVRVGALIEDQVLVLTVANEGEPIRPENLAMVFEPYWRPHNSKPGGGLGLGLYICAQIAKVHGGELTVRSAADSGTVFEARLPIVLAR
ncbi:GAF domain-containing sensor histidine kinase [Variovorax saccharolyticus]|uniref:GAF domain-containing sensor histidine kinase n=1 Tax=Variovorax saccharolyticus TaxID=3053516 RepID=UPI0025790DFE|nr:GAF domain-containing sensor histidine kinase [Variovorax sp. J31P216]MDM0023438.1 GAF domain-containing sensor histidine kinase [Variovorax sp. J31P216]